MRSYFSTESIREWHREAVSALLDISIALGTEAETRAVMQVYVDVVRSFPPADLNSPLYIFERLCGLIVPEKKKAKETVFQISLEKDPLQEEFLQGRMQGPYRSDDHGLGPTMRDIKNKICTGNSTLFACALLLCKSHIMFTYEYVL